MQPPMLLTAVGQGAAMQAEELQATEVGGVKGCSQFSSGKHSKMHLVAAGPATELAGKSSSAHASMCDHFSSAHEK